MVAYDAAAIDCVQTVLSSAHDADGLASQHAVTALITFGVLPSPRGGGVDPATIGPSAARMNYREAEAVTVSCFAERVENIRRLFAYDPDAFSTGLYSPRPKGILSEYLDCPSQTMV